MISGRIVGSVDQLVLQCCVEALGQRVVIAYSGAPYGLPEIKFPQRFREFVRCVITAAVRVEDCLAGELVISRGHLNGLLDERGLVVIVHRPAD
jgi:hypothetical protein